MKRTTKSFVLAILVILLISVFVTQTRAASVWHSDRKRTWYSVYGNKRLHGLQKIGGRYYYFDKAGYLKTGWVTLNDGSVRYFRRNGKPGVRGRMYTGGIHKAWTGKRFALYGFDKSGNPLKGLQKINSHCYFFRTTGGAGLIGRMYRNRWVTLPDKRKIYLMEDGKMAVGRWTHTDDGYYYVGKDGNQQAGKYKPDRWGMLLARYETDPDTNQLIFVKYLGGSRADIVFYVKNGGSWEIQFKSSGFVGQNGIDKKKEGDRRTPTGTFNITSGFGIAENPGTRPRMPYVHVNEYLYWCADRSHYNTLVDTRTSSHKYCNGEHLISYTQCYQYGMFLDFNKEGVYKKGSAIFLHCKGNNPYTGGCVAVDQPRMIEILRTVTPGAKICIYRK